MTFLEPRKVVRIIGKEASIPLLGCVSEEGFIRDVEGSNVNNRSGRNPVETSQTTAILTASVIIPDEINLTRRVLEPMHRFHKLAARCDVPEILCNETVA